MEITRDLLTKHVAAEIFIGKTKHFCYVAKLTFDKGFIEWTMDSQQYVNVDSLLNQPPATLKVPYMDSFFGFTDYVENINNVCKAWMQYNFILERINLLADLFKEYFPWCTFVLHCPLVKPQQLESLSFVEFVSESFIRYLQQVASVVKTSKKAMTYFLRELLEKTGFNRDPEINLSVGTVLIEESLPVEKLDLAVKAFYREYVNTWMPKLKLACQPTDKHDIPTAMLIAERCGLSALAVHRYLDHRDKSLSKADQEKAFREARLAKFQDKVQ